MLRKLFRAESRPSFNHIVFTYDPTIYHCPCEVCQASHYVYVN